MRYFIELQYDGGAYCGWQRQPEQPTVQGTIEDALTKLLRQPTEIVGAGRTDTGVNASFYVAHFDSEEAVDCNHLTYKLNAMLAQDIAIKRIYQVADDLHARFDAIEREYTYFLSPVKSPFRRHSAWICYYTLDIEKMNEAAGHLLGEHDFSCFEKVGGNNATSICTVTEAVWKTYRPMHADMMGFPCEEGDYIVFRIRANRFLRNMVRAVVGSLIEVGRGKKDPSWITELIASGNRSDAGSSVPGNALFFSGAEYK